MTVSAAPASRTSRARRGRCAGAWPVRHTCSAVSPAWPGGEVAGTPGPYLTTSGGTTGSFGWGGTAISVGRRGAPACVAGCGGVPAKVRVTSSSPVPALLSSIVELGAVPSRHHGRQHFRSGHWYHP